MSRITVCVLCMFLSLVVMAAIATPVTVRAAYIKLAYDASLQENPQDAAFSLTMLPAGVVVTTTGDPVDGYYPVTAGGKSGWVRGDALALDPVADGAPAELDPAIPAPEPAVPDEPVAEESLPIDPVAEESLPVDPVAAEPTPVELADENLAPVQPVAEATPVSEPALLEPLPAEPVGGEAALAVPEAQNPTDAATAPEAAPPVSDLDPNAPPVAVPDPGPVGPAAVVADVPIYAGPGPEFGILGTAEVGQFVEQTGHAVGGYVTVRYVGVTGWVPLDHLGPPPTTAIG